MASNSAVLFRGFAGFSLRVDQVAERNREDMKRSGCESRLIIVCGLPGSGKTTHAERLETEVGAVRLCADDWMDALNVNLCDESMRAKVEALQWVVARRLLALDRTVIVEWGTWGRTERDTLRLGARALGAQVELHYLSASVDVLFQRIQQRHMEYPPIKRDDLLRWVEKFQEPSKEEIALFDEFLAREF